MSLDLALGLVVSAGLVAYLAYVLVHPDRF